METSDKASKKKKKHWRQKYNKKNSNASTFGTPTFKVNTTNNFDWKKYVKKDISQITFWNYNKKGNYSNNCLEFLKPKN